MTNPISKFQASGVDISYEDHSPAEMRKGSSKVLLLGETHSKTEKSIAAVIQEMWRPGDVILIEGISGSTHAFQQIDRVKAYGLANTQRVYGWDDVNSLDKFVKKMKQIRILTSLLLDLQQSRSKVGVDETASVKQLIKHIDSNHLLDIDKIEIGGESIRTMLNSKKYKSAINLLAMNCNELMQDEVSQTFEARNQAMANAIEHFKNQNVNRIFVIAGAAHLIKGLSRTTVEDPETNKIEKGVENLHQYLKKAGVNYQIWRPFEVSEEEKPKLSRALETKKQKLDSTVWKVIQGVYSVFFGLASLVLFPLVIGYTAWQMYKTDLAFIDLIKLSNGEEAAKFIAKSTPFLVRSHPELSSQDPQTIQKALIKLIADCS